MKTTTVPLAGNCVAVAPMVCWVPGAHWNEHGDIPALHHPLDCEIVLPAAGLAVVVR